jgi:hypothetical protein
MPARVSLPQTPNPSSTDANPEAYSPKRGRPFLFQVIAPGTNQPLYSYLLALHVNPESLEERMSATKTVVPTRGGWIEYRWPNELSSLSGSNTTGSFYSPSGGLTAGSDASQTGGKARGRQGTIAWERQEDLLELFHSNGMVFDGNGEPAIRGRIMLIYDRGIYYGFFTTFEVSEDDQHAYSFQLSWEFTIEQTLYRFPTKLGSSGINVPAPAPLFPGAAVPTPGSQNSQAFSPANNPADAGIAELLSHAPPLPE